MDWNELLASLEDVEDPPKTPTECEVCGTGTGELRRGRCWPCYTRWSESRAAGYGATCVVCGERRQAYLKLIELLGSFLPMCGNCGLRLARLPRLPGSLEGLRQSLRRERRGGADRRRGLPDTRSQRVDRRGPERREVRVDDCPEMVIQLDDWDIVIDEGEDTGIVQFP